MILTETEAKTKYCPMTFMNPLKMTRLSKGNKGFKCAGSECMWWEDRILDTTRGYCGVTR